MNRFFIYCVLIIYVEINNITHLVTKDSKKQGSFVPGPFIPSHIIVLAGR